MKIYTVTLSRTYRISIKANNEYDAKLFSEYYIGDCPDLSNTRDQKEKNFSIKNIELVYNEAYNI